MTTSPRLPLAQRARAGVASLVMTAALGVAPLMAQGAPPRPQRAAADTIAPAQAPSPALHAPARVPALQRVAAPAPVAAAAPGSPAPAQLRPAPIAGAKAPAPAPQERGAPPPRPAADPSPAGPGASALLAPAGPPPPGATMRCKDGTYLSGPPVAANCAQHAGVAVVFPPVHAPPAGPARVRRP